jgi:hypothetical protein
VRKLSGVRIYWVREVGAVWCAMLTAAGDRPIMRAFEGRYERGDVPRVPARASGRRAGL